MQIKSIKHKSFAMLYQKPNTLSGLEPGSSVPEADAGGQFLKPFLCLQKVRDWLTLASGLVDAWAQSRVTS
jgi:hypothetical protein